jgi:predicted lipoprotein with Yx(FWY)xxD motif
MKSLVKYSIPVVVVLAFLAGGIALASDPAIKVAKKDGIGSYLACDVTGMTLYNFKKDTPGKSACEGECLAKWPLYYVDKVPGDTNGQGVKDVWYVVTP